MKKNIFSFSLFFLSIGFSLQAMEGIGFAPYYAPWHRKKVTKIFKEAFPESKTVDEAISTPSLDPSSKVIVAEHNGIPRGFIIYSHGTISTADEFNDIYPSDDEQLLQVCKISRLAVSDKYKKKKIGSQLMQLVQTQALANRDGAIFLQSINNSRPFYEKQGFLCTKSEPLIDHMAKPLNNEMSALLASVIAIREQNQLVDVLAYPDEI